MVVVDCRMALSSGIGTYVCNLLPRIVRAAPEYEFTGLARSSDIPRLRALISGVEFRPCDARVYSPYEQIALIRSAPRTARIFWSPHINVPILFRGRLLVTVHDLFPFAFASLTNTRIDKLVYTRAMLRLVRARAAGVICVSTFTASELVRLLGPLRQPLTVAHNGVDCAWFEAREAPVLRAGPYVVYVGNVKPHKNLPRLITAFAKLAHRLPHELVIAGQREGFADHARVTVADEARLLEQGRLHYTGRLEDDELRQLVAQADALVLPSLYEGFGLPPLEAMAAGVPVLVARAAALPEVCGDAALYCDPLLSDDIAAQLERLLLEPSLRERLRARGRAHAQTFRWDRSAELTLSALRRL